MKVLESSALLVIGTVLLTFCTLSYLVFPRPLTLGNPGMFMQALFLAGLAFAVLGARGMYRIHLALSGKAFAGSAHAAQA